MPFSDENLEQCMSQKQENFEYINVGLIILSQYMLENNQRETL